MSTILRKVMCLVCALMLLVMAGLLPAGPPIQPCYNYPPMELQVPFLCQYGPPGDVNTVNCGQTCGVMLSGYYGQRTPVWTEITAADTWLAKKLKDSRYNNANGYYTHFNDANNSLGLLLKEYFGLKYTVKTGRDISSVLDELKAGRPVIVGVKISGGKLVSKDQPGVAHWALAVGWNPKQSTIILHDPGTKSGRYKQYTVEDFENTWATQGRIFAPVTR